MASPSASGGARRQGGGGGDHHDNKKRELFHVVHKVPAGDSPYVRAKQLQLVEKKQEAAIAWFWKAINAGDRVESALKDMAVVMAQQDRAEEAVEAIKSFRHLCPKQSQESLDNILIDLYKKCGRLEEQIDLLKQKLRKIYAGQAFNGKPTKTARSHGKKFKVTIKQESSRILGNMGWAYMKQSNYLAAEAVYRKAQIIDPDSNKACNLGLCLIRQARFDEARSVLDDVRSRWLPGSDDPRTAERAEELLKEIELQLPGDPFDVDRMVIGWASDDTGNTSVSDSDDATMADSPDWVEELLDEIETEPMMENGYEDEWTPFQSHGLQMFPMTP